MSSDKTRRRAWRKKALVLGVLVAFIATIGGWLLTRDIEPIDDSDLLPVRREVADGDNGWLLLPGWEAYSWPRGHRFVSDDDALDDSRLAEAVTEGRTWHDKLARSVLEANAATLDLLEDILAAKHIQAPDGVGIDFEQSRRESLRPRPEPLASPRQRKPGRPARILKRARPKRASRQGPFDLRLRLPRPLPTGSQ